MAKSSAQVIDDAIKKGGVYAILYLDLHGNNEEVLKNLMVGQISQITEIPGVLAAVGEIEPPIEFQGDYSTSASVKILTRDFFTLCMVGTRFSVVGVEIVKPLDVKLTAGEAQKVV